MNISFGPDVITALLPINPVFPKPSLFPATNPKISPLLNNLLENIQRIQENWMQLQLEMIHGKKKETNEYGKYLEYPNAAIKALAMSIVEPADTNDMKAYKVMLWIQENIEYKSDIENYGKGEFWALPSLTISNESGDCEDGAFLMHSLMLNAGIPWENIRTYGGLVYAGPGAIGGGHGWTAYKRETDNEWVILDWCYYANETPIADRILMKDDMKYFDDFFYVSKIETVETPYTNAVKNPPALAVGSKIDIYT